MEHVRIREPFRTMLYVPHYAAMGLGLFAQAGLEADLGTVPGPNGVARALQTGEAEIGLSGPIRALAAADRGEARLTCVAEVASRAGFFLLGRTPADLQWRDLRGRRVLVPAEPPTPRLVLEYLLERHEVSLATVDLVADLPPEQAIDAFVGGRADFLLQGQPAAEVLLAGGRAHVAAALGPALGPVAFSAYLVTPRVLAERPRAVGAAIRALARAQHWLREATPPAIAAGVAWAFPDLERSVLERAIQRYVAGRTWPADPVLRRAGFDALQEVLLLRGFIRRSHPYGELCDTTLAEAALRAPLAGGVGPR